MISKRTPRYEEVDAKPVKSFFVNMLTRDIDLTDAILDLLDNCVDGVLRSIDSNTAESPEPYRDRYADIRFDSKQFSITDNCGGIPWSKHDYAFRMGRPKENDELGRRTVGTYGIGMKRAIFKLGRNCTISTQHKEDNYQVSITENWINDEESWKIPVHPISQRMTEDGTTLVVTKLHHGIAARFNPQKKDFLKELTDRISTVYAVIIGKGFKVRVNGKTIIGRPMKLVFMEDGDVKPYVYRAEHNGVDIFLAVGFTRPIISDSEALKELDEKQYSTENAGWTIVCNDRAVIYCDKTELTGWGTAGIPRYHTQFIAISGIVEFTSANPTALPTTTSKRGIDASSPLFIHVKERMQQGMKLFTDSTNQWKGKSREARNFISKQDAVSIPELKAQLPDSEFKPVKKGLGGEQLSPRLPRPTVTPTTTIPIAYSKRVEEIDEVAMHLFGTRDVKASRVGEKCFDRILHEARD